MTHYLKSKDGKFAGSIGDGKDHVPASAPELIAKVTEDVQALTELDRLKALAERFDQQKEAAENLYSGFELNTEYPAPQANSLAKIAAVVDAVNSTADTDASLATALDVHPRQGAYYATAAAYLGLISEAGSDPRSWRLTNQGAEFLNGSADERVKMLSALTNKMPSAQAALDDTDSAAETIAEETLLNETTATRRAATVASWVETLTSGRASEELTLETDGVRGRIDAAVAVANEQRRGKGLSAEEWRASLEKSTCPECFMIRTGNGSCSC